MNTDAWHGIKSAHKNKEAREWKEINLCPRKESASLTHSLRQTLSRGALLCQADSPADPLAGTGGLAGCAPGWDITSWPQKQVSIWKFASSHPLSLFRMLVGQREPREEKPTM